MAETTESNIPEAAGEESELGQILEAITAQQAMFGDMVESLDSINAHNATQTDKQLNEASLFKVIETVAGAALKLVSIALDNVLYLDNIAVSNSDLRLDMDKLAERINDQTFKIGALDEHLETEIALHRIGYKNIDVDLRDSIVLMDKQGQQGQELIKLMADFSAKGATQQTLEIMGKGIASINENTSTQARAAIRALEQLGDVEGVMQAMGMDQQLIQNVLGAIEVAGLSPQQGIAMGKLADELIHPDDIRKAVLFGTIDAGREILKKGQTPAEFLSVMQDVSKRVPAEFAERFAPFMDPLLFERGIAMYGGELTNLAISMRTAFDDPDRKKAEEEIATTVGFKDAVDTYTESLVKANDMLKDMFLEGGRRTLVDLRDDMEGISTEMANFREAGAAAVKLMGKTSLGVVFKGITAALIGADFIRDFMGKLLPGFEEDKPLRFEPVDSPKAKIVSFTPNEYRDSSRAGTEEGSKSGIIAGIEWLVENGILSPPRRRKVPAIRDA